VIEPHLPDRRDGVGVEFMREIDAADLGADRPDNGRMSSRFLTMASILPPHP